MLKEIVIAIQSWGEAHRFVIRHRLWKWVVIPGLIYTALFLAGMYFFGRSATAVIEYVTHILQLSDWIQRFQSGFLGFLFTFAGIIIWLTLLLCYFSVFKYLFLIIGSPVFAYVSRKTELILAGSDQSPEWPAVRKEAARGIRVALRSGAWQILYLAGLLLLSLVPVVGWITPLIVLLLECYYYGASMVDYGMARNKLPMKESLAFISRHKGLALGNGIMFYLLHIAIIFAPSYAIIAATLSVQKLKLN
ncbi:MAG TPA: EI24 domain-containing protein [Chitinophagaceae bacterium]|nr:EI24 domain-containing protein [Chitinophagaceae bacterium]